MISIRIRTAPPKWFVARFIFPFIVVAEFLEQSKDRFSNLEQSAFQIFSESGADYKRLTNAKIISGTLIVITFLMGFFLLSAVYIQTSSRCVCAYGPGMPYQQSQESQNTPYFEPLKALSPEGTSDEMRNFPLKIHMNDPKVTKILFEADLDKNSFHRF